jgi:FtsX-like permease family
MDDLNSERPVVIIDERMANQLWPGGAVGQRLGVSRGRSFVSLEVIGVTNPVRVTRVRDDGMPHLFVPYHFLPIEMALMVSTRESAATIAPAIKQAVESLGTRRPVYDIRPLQFYVDRSIGDTRFTMLVLVGFAVAALLLAAVGLYGTLAYLTSLRTQEFGVRMALGASAARILRSVATEGLLLTAVGGALGLIGALAMSAVLRDLLYGVAPNDGTTLGSSDRSRGIRRPHRREPPRLGCGEDGSLFGATRGMRVTSLRSPAAGGSPVRELEPAKPETGDRRPATGDRRPETGDRRPETGDRRPETAPLLLLLP